MPHPVEVIYPASGQVFFERLRYASILQRTGRVCCAAGAFARCARWTDPRDGDSVCQGEDLARLCIIASSALATASKKPTVSACCPTSLRSLASRADIKRLQTDGFLLHRGQTVQFSDVSAPRIGQKVTVVMDATV